VLVDTGATRSVISAKFMSKLGVRPTVSADMSDLLTANNSPMHSLGQVELNVCLDGLIVPHTFTVVDSLHHNCILGLDFLLATNAKLNFQDCLISFYDDLVVLPLISSSSTDFILRLSHSLRIPPHSEAISNVTINSKYRLQPSIVEPLPTLYKRNLGLARILVHPKRHTTICRLLNPLDKSIFLPARTPIAIISPVDLQDPANIRLLHTNRTQPQPDIQTITEEPIISHSQRIAELDKIGLKMVQDKLSDADIELLTACVVQSLIAICNTVTLINTGSRVCKPGRYFSNPETWVLRLSNPGSRVAGFGLLTKF